MIKIKTPPCTLCGEASMLEVKKEQFELWRRGELIQTVWPEWSPGERELLITGTHSECWDKMFAEDE